jgi:hypothetical protein
MIPMMKREIRIQRSRVERRSNSLLREIKFLTSEPPMKRNGPFIS